ncbi:hypothetical protein ACFVW2_40640, partial [Streptomyces sp. NPDC058171]
SLPAGFSEAGTPLGIQLVGRHRAEDQLLDMAKDFEQRTRHAWTRPRSGASVDHRPGDEQRD